MSGIPGADSARIKEAVGRFERAWKAGVPRPIEDFLEGLDQPRRAVLLYELLRVELALRQRPGEEPSLEEYCDRFPKDRAVIDAAFSAKASPIVTISPSESPSGTDIPPVASASSANPIPPELVAIGDYEFIRVLGGGSMGQVFLVHNHIMGRDEVLKLISQDVIEKPGVLERFVREIRAVAKLRHPNIVAAYSGFRAGKSLVFAMEYVDGLDLARLVKAKGPMPVRNACSFISQAALGLQHAHEAGMVHRDIKPGNLMLARDGDRAIIKVLDFGIAKAGREQELLDHGLDAPEGELGESGDLTVCGQMMGTPSFIAPEQILDAKKADIRADIYSLGCTLYYLLSGRPPFEGTLLQVLRAHRSKEAQPLNLVRSEIPTELADLVAKMMAKKPAQRFQEPAEVATALTPFFRTRNLAVTSTKSSDSSGGQLEEKPETIGMAVVPEWLAGERPSAVEIPTELTGSLPKWDGGVELDLNVDELWDPNTAEVSEPAKRPPWILTAVIGSGGLSAVLTAALIAVYLFGGNAGKLKIPGFGSPPAHSEQPAPIVGPSGHESRPNLSEGQPSKAIAGSSSRETAKAVIASPPPAPRVPEVKESPAAMSPPKTVVPKTVVKKDELLRPVPKPPRSAFEESVDQAVRAGVDYLKGQQNKDGSWNELDDKTRTGMTSLVTLALLTAGEKPTSTEIHSALLFLRRHNPKELDSTYAIALQTMVYAAAEPDLDRVRIAANVEWLEQAQLQKTDVAPWPGSWGYSDSRGRQPGDGSNTHYALMGLHAASEVGVVVKPQVWVLAREYWENSQKRDGSFAYTPISEVSTASMTCAGISSLIITGLRRNEGQEILQNGEIHNCGKALVDRNLRGGINWLGEHCQVNVNLGGGQIWKFYYLCDLERAGRLTGWRFFGTRDWYRLGAEELVRIQTRNPPSGYWEGTLLERNRLVATSFALLFLARGGAPVLINKLVHRPTDDWNDDPNDVRNLVSIVSRDRNSLLNWRAIDPKTASVSELLQAPILFFNGHRAPVFTNAEKDNLREYVKRGGALLAEACCGREEFDKAFKAMMAAMFPAKENALRPLSEDHPIWRSKHKLDPGIHPIWGIQHGARTTVFYSPNDLSCYWNQANHDPSDPSVIKALQVGQNVVEYVTAGK